MGKSRFNFAFIGAGSVTFTLKLISDILHGSDVIHGGEIRLVDVDENALERIFIAAERLIKNSGGDFKVTKHSDFREGLPGVDYVFFTFVAGGFSSWKRDIEICTKHGVMQSVGDTIGPGGIIRTLRNVPVAYEVAEEMEKLSPDAWIINYTNPEGAMCSAVSRYTKIKIFGLCHGTPDTVKDLAAKVYKVPDKQLKYRAAGINHLTWITELQIDGRDVYPELRALLKSSGYDSVEPISAQLFDIFGLYPAPGDRHVGEFFPFYIKEDVLREKGYKWGNVDFGILEGWREDGDKRAEAVIKGKMSCQEFGRSGESAIEFIKALETGELTIEMANVVNKGYIENISDGLIVEVPVFVDSFGIHPTKAGRLPDGIAAKCESLGREYALAVDAAISGDRMLALQAMMLDPLTANCSYPDLLLKELMDEYNL